MDDSIKLNTPKETGREVDNGFDENPHKHYILGASAHGLNVEKPIHRPLRCIGFPLLNDKIVTIINRY